MLVHLLWTTQENQNVFPNAFISIQKSWVRSLHPWLIATGSRGTRSKTWNHRVWPTLTVVDETPLIFFFFFPPMEWYGMSQLGGPSSAPKGNLRAETGNLRIHQDLYGGLGTPSRKHTHARNRYHWSIAILQKRYNGSTTRLPQVYHRPTTDLQQIYNRSIVHPS